MSVAGDGKSDWRTPHARVERLINKLKKTDSNCTVYSDVSTTLSVFESAQKDLEHTYSYLFQALTEDIASKIASDDSDKKQNDLELPQIKTPPSVDDIRIRAIQIKSMTDALSEQINRSSAQSTKKTISTAVEHTNTPPQPSQSDDSLQPQASTQKKQADKNDNDIPTLNATEANRPEKNDDYMALQSHMDEELSKIHHIQIGLTKRIEEAVAQNHLHTSFLENQLWTLRNAINVSKVDEMRRNLIDNVDKIVQDQYEHGNELNHVLTHLKDLEYDSQQLNEELRQLRRLSLTDDLTGLPNRRAFTQRVEEELSRVQRSGYPLVLAMIDLDGFKAINDVYGHSFGDAVLQRYAELVLTAFRHHDMVARYGGEEFAAVLPYTNQADAITALEKAQNQAAEAIFQWEDITISMPTFSAGLTLYQPSDTLMTLINRADKAMYRAKGMGRNRIEIDNGAPSKQSPRNPTRHLPPRD